MWPIWTKKITIHLLVILGKWYSNWIETYLFRWYRNLSTWKGQDCLCRRWCLPLAHTAAIQSCFPDEKVIHCTWQSRILNIQKRWLLCSKQRYRGTWTNLVDGNATHFPALVPISLQSVDLSLNSMFTHEGLPVCSSACWFLVGSSIELFASFLVCPVVKMSAFLLVCISLDLSFC